MRVRQMHGIDESGLRELMPKVRLVFPDGDAA